jgi:thymidine kinase
MVGHPLQRRGRIELIIGPMFAGKSTELLRRVKRHQIAGSRCLRIKFAGDTRYSADSIATHDRYLLPHDYVDLTLIL